MADLAVSRPLPAVEEMNLLRTSTLLLLIVFALKAAVLPLHSLAAGPLQPGSAPVAALFAIMTKVGIYAILRTFTLILPMNGAGSDVSGVLPWIVALLTLAAGAWGCSAARRLTVLIAYLVVVSVGTLLAGISLFSVPGLTAALFYLPHTTLVTGRPVPAVPI